MLHLTLCTLHSTLGTPHSTLHTLYTLHFTLRIFHFAFDTSHSTIPTSYPTPHSALNTPLSLHPTLCTPPHSTLHSLYWYGNRGRMYKTVERTCCTKVFYVAAFGFVVCSCFFSISLFGGTNGRMQRPT